MARGSLARLRPAAAPPPPNDPGFAARLSHLEVTHHTITANGIRHHHVEAGEGAPVVLLHGFPVTHYAWWHQIPVLAQHYRVIAPDLRGYGKTEKPASGYDKWTMANDLRALPPERGPATR